MQTQGGTRESAGLARATGVLRAPLLVFTVAAVLILQACAGTTASPVTPASGTAATAPANAPSAAASAAAGEKCELTQWYHQYGEEGTQQAVLRYAQEYMTANPNVTVKVEWVPGDYAQKVQAALLTDSGPDLYETQVAAPASVNAGQMADLTDLFPADVKADFSPKAFEAYTVDGKIYAIPFVQDLGLMYYRKSLLDAAGITVPKTFEEFAAAAKKLTTDSTSRARSWATTVEPAWPTSSLMPRDRTW